MFTYESWCELVFVDIDAIELNSVVGVLLVLVCTVFNTAFSDVAQRSIFCLVLAIFEVLFSSCFLLLILYWYSTNTSMLFVYKRAYLSFFLLFSSFYLLAYTYALDIHTHNSRWQILSSYSIYQRKEDRKKNTHPHKRESCNQQKNSIVLYTFWFGTINTEKNRQDGEMEKSQKSTEIHLLLIYQFYLHQSNIT